MDKCQFTNNNAIVGGAIYWTCANGTVTESQFTGNNATLGGANGTIKDSNFTNNKANRMGALRGTSLID